MNHTKGPLKFISRRGGSIIDQDGSVVAELAQCRGASPQELMRRHADGLMLAAAPEMLEALEELLAAYKELRISEWSRPRDQWDSNCDLDSKALNAISVIAKARGEK